MARHGMERRASRGQILVVFAVSVVAILAITGLVIDGLRLHAAQRAAQGAADLAALAGALDLPGDDVVAQDEAVANASANGYSDDSITTVSTRSPFNGDQNRIEVVITRRVSLVFLPVVGMLDATIDARAVAVNRTGTYALFAARTACDGIAHETINITGSGSVVVGNVHSSGGINVTGSNNTFDGHVSYKCNNKFVDSGTGNTYSSGPERTGPVAWPVTHDAASLGCTFSVADGTDIGSDSGPWWEPPGPASLTLRDGTYCVLGTIKLSGSDISGRITMIAFGAAGQVLVSGSNLNLLPFASGILALSQGTGPDAISISGSGGSWEGLLYAPEGRVKVSGSNNLIARGSIVADTITLSGSDWQLIAEEPGNRGPQLVE